MRTRRAALHCCGQRYALRCIYCTKDALLKVTDQMKRAVVHLTQAKQRLCTQRETHTDRDRDRETQRDRERKTDRDRETDRDRDRERQTQTERQRKRDRRRQVV